jgi:hypothetical protein
VQVRQAVKSKGIEAFQVLLEMTTVSKIFFAERAENAEYLSVDIASAVVELLLGKNVIILAVGPEVLQNIVQGDCISWMSW